MLDNHEVKAHPGQDHGPNVTFTYINNGEEARFHAPWGERLRVVWDEAYRELEEARKDTDELLCEDGPSLMEHLDLTLEQLRERHICSNRRFEIRCETGGA